MPLFERLTLQGWRQFAELNVPLDAPCVVLTGVNGSGKTTLLNILAKHFGWNVPFISTPLIGRKRAIDAGTRKHGNWRRHCRLRGGVMRKLTKLQKPAILEANEAAWIQAVVDHPSETNKTRYRDQEIKTRLIEETGEKCVYCESKMRPVTPKAHIKSEYSAMVRSIFAQAGLNELL